MMTERIKTITRPARKLIKKRSIAISKLTSQFLWNTLEASSIDLTKVVFSKITDIAAYLMISAKDNDNGIKNVKKMV